LVRLGSLVTGDETARVIYVSTEILHDVSPPFADTRDGQRLVEFRQTLDAFVEGAEFSVADDPDTKPTDAMLARVHPVNAHIWDIRSIAPRPGIRALGGFLARDEFVALTWDYRENLDGPGKWDEEIARCQSIWRELFGDVEPFDGASHECLTNFYPV
jgi:hypothetical protein